MWSYSQASGALTAADGSAAGSGYAGHGAGVNNPALQAVADVGPLPQGLYSIGAPVEHTELGPFALPLVAHDGNEMFGRSGFYIHGDSLEHPGAEDASRGCIVLSPDVRRRVWASGDHVLRVTQ